MRIELNYPSSFTINTTLRPHILLEFTLSDIKLSAENLTINTLIEDTLESITLFEPSSTACISVTETAIEKWVGLTRRIIAIERKYHPDDPALIRHVFDLHAIQQTSKINADFFTLAKTIINNDIKQFKNQHPEYAADPNAEIYESLKLLQNKPLWKTRYQDFIEAMVYDKVITQNYNHAMQTLKNMSETIIHLNFK